MEDITILVEAPFFPIEIYICIKHYKSKNISEDLSMTYKRRKSRSKYKSLENKQDRTAYVKSLKLYAI